MRKRGFHGDKAALSTQVPAWLRLFLKLVSSHHEDTSPCNQGQKWDGSPGGVGLSGASGGWDPQEPLLPPPKQSPGAGHQPGGRLKLTPRLG